MSKLRVACLSLSIDGYGAGPNQSLQDPLGVGGIALHEWVFPTRTFQQMHGDKNAEGTTGIDDDYAARGVCDIGAWILGRNMFGPHRGAWAGTDWKGWWGDEPPYHNPVFILSHHPRESITMAGGTTFHFVTDGIHSALARAKQAAQGQDVRVGGGMDTIKQYLRERLIDELHIAIAPVLLGAGENLYTDVDLRALSYRCVERVCTPQATHIVLQRQD